jgi:ABC-type glycerol-3-phosphate transport system permease component
MGRRVGVWRTFRYAVLIAGALLTVAPFLVMVGTSFKPHAYVLELPPRIVPSDPTLDNYRRALTSNNFDRYFVNSLVVAVATAAITVLFAAMLAYGFARWDFPGRSVLFYAVLATMMVPSLVLIIPQFVLARNLHLLDSLWGLVVVYYAGGAAYSMFLLRGFFEDIPQDLIDAAVVDGAGPFRTFWDVALPLARPAIAAVAIFSFLGAWDEFTWALTAISDDELYTLPIAIRLFQGQHASEWGLVFAASTIAVLPTLAVFVLFQRHFIKGVMSGSVKG